MDDRKVTFKRNLRGLTQHFDLNLKQVASGCSFDSAGYKWLRRVASQGLTRIQQNNQEKVRRLSDFFLGRISEELVSKNPDSKSRMTSAHGRLKVLWSPELFNSIQSEASRVFLSDELVIQNFFRLITSGKHEYLRDLVADLYARSIHSADED